MTIHSGVQRNSDNRAPPKEETCFHEGLLPCPFCGGMPKIECYPTLTIIECKECGVRYSGHGALSDKQVFEGICWLEIVGRWNRRAT